MEDREISCPQCSQAVLPGHSVVSVGGRLAHVNCQRPRTLTGDERALLFYYCLDHVVARCVACAQNFGLSELAVDLLRGRTHLCPSCRRDLTETVRGHLYECAMLPAEVRRRARALRDAAQHLVKQSRQLRDQADVLIREAETAVEASRRDLWQVLKTPRHRPDLPEPG
jgi:DNA-directed RNA polymerase subunit RPC12/RpoP